MIKKLVERIRSCPVTGLKVDLNAEKLIKFNAVTAIVCLLFGGIAALGLILTRWEAIHLLSAQLFYRFLTLHGLNMLIFFIIFFEMAVLYFAAPVLLSARLPLPKLGWIGYGLMLLGAVMVNVIVLMGKGDVLFTSYPPLKADPLYYLGIIFFAVGALIGVSHFFISLIVAKKEKAYEGAMPLVTFGALTAAIIAVITLIHGAMIYIPTFLWSLDIMPMDPQIYRLLFWALGHSSQQINVAAMVAIWYLLAGLTVGGVVMNEKISRIAFFLYILFISLASAHHLLVDPGMGSGWKIWNTSYAMYLAVLASMVHGFTVPAGIEMGQRLKGFNNGLFEWLRKAPWRDPGFSGMVLSIIIFGFLGGITGVIIGTEQINMIAHNTLRIPGHFHTTVVGGTALAFMAVTYYLLPLIFRRRIRFWKLAEIQPYLFGIGIVVMSMAMTFMGVMGVPRRHWGFSQSPFQVDFNPIVSILQAFVGIGGVIAIIGLLSFILIAVATVFFGKKLENKWNEDPTGLPQGVLNFQKQVYTGAEVANVHRIGARGTLVLVFVFLACFIGYFFLNLKMLSFIWKVG